MNPTISVGDIVRLTDTNCATDYLKSFVGRDLTVTSAANGGISFKEDASTAHYRGAYFGWRFTKVADAPKANVVKPNNVKGAVVTAGPARDKAGRFISPKNTVKPQALRPGALYMVKRKRNNQLAHLRKVIAEKDGSQTLVMSRHGKNFFARRENVTLASDAQVQTYLKESKAAK